MTIDLAFRRLRAANPVRAVSTADAHALFERITSLPPDPRLGQPSRRLPRRAVLVLAVALLVVAMLASTAPAISNWVGDIIGPSEVDSEYAKAASRLSFPPGYEWPKSNFPADSVTSRGGGGAMAVMAAVGAWECYWVDAIHDHDPAAKRSAHAALRDLLANHIVVAPKGASENWAPPQSAQAPTAAFADDGGYEYKQRMYAAAAAGQPQLLEQSCRANGVLGAGG